MLLAAIALGSLALKTGSAIAKHKAQGDAREATVRAADANFRASLTDISARMVEEARSASLAVDRAGVRAGEALGSARVSAAASGVSGRSIDLLLQDIERDRAQHRHSVNQNLAAVRRQGNRLKEQASAHRLSQIAGVPKPSIFATGLEIGSAALDTYTGSIANRGGV